mgnify:CR=1 FL=1
MAASSSPAADPDPAGPTEDEPAKPDPAPDSTDQPPAPAEGDQTNPSGGDAPALFLVLFSSDNALQGLAVHSGGNGGGALAGPLDHAALADRNENIATVEGGSVTGKAGGTVTITAAAGEQQHAPARAAAAVPLALLHPLAAPAAQGLALLNGRLLLTEGAGPGSLWSL